jgi:hypothetical protein
VVAEDGTVYYRYGNALVNTETGLASSLSVSTDKRFVSTITYTVPKVEKYVMPDTILDSGLRLDENNLPVGKDKQPFTYDNRTYFYPVYERRTPALA